jgi:hypothetical protein
LQTGSFCGNFFDDGFPGAAAAGERAVSLIKEKNSNKKDGECRIKELLLFYS